MLIHVVYILYGTVFLTIIKKKKQEEIKDKEE